MFVDINKISKLEIVIASNRKNENIYEEMIVGRRFENTKLIIGDDEIRLYMKF